MSYPELPKPEVSFPEIAVVASLLTPVEFGSYLQDQSADTFLLESLETLITQAACRLVQICSEKSGHLLIQVAN